MNRLANAYCDFGEAMTVFGDDSLAYELSARAITAKYSGTDVATGERIEVGDKIASLGSGWTHVIKEA